MSSQASSAGHGEKEVRRKLVESGDVDVMISIGSNFFYTRTVPCELWFFDRGKPAERQGQVLMLDARGIFRKVSRTVNDFSPEQLKNLSAIVWLYRGQQERFLSLVREYLGRVCEAGAEVGSVLDEVERSLAELRLRVDALLTASDGVTLAPDVREKLTVSAREWAEAQGAYASDRAVLVQALGDFVERYGTALPQANAEQHAAHKAFVPIAERVRGVERQVGLLCKLASRAVDACAAAVADERSLADAFDRRGVARLVKALDEVRQEVAAALNRVTYFHAQVEWLHRRFPDAELCDVPGLVKAVGREEIEAADWSLTPGRYVGVAPEELDADFDFLGAMREIHDELRALDSEASGLAGLIQITLSQLVA